MELLKGVFNMTMNVYKMIRLVIGAALAIAGVYCILSPSTTIAVMAWIVGIFMVVHALSKIGIWRERKALGFAENCELIGAVISLLFGAALLISNFFQTLVGTFIIYVFASWIATLGVIRLLVASNLRRLQADISVHINNYNSQMINGALLILVAVVIFIRPGMVVSMIGIFTGICLLLFGAEQIVTALRE